MTASPTTEHIAPALVNGAAICAASPTTDVTFVSAPTSPTNTTINLGDPPSPGPDGRRKIIVLEQSDTNYHVIVAHFASGTEVYFPGSGGVLALIWNAHDKLWYLESTTGGTIRIA